MPITGNIKSLQSEGRYLVRTPIRQTDSGQNRHHYARITTPSPTHTNNTRYAASQ